MVSSSLLELAFQFYCHTEICSSWLSDHENLNKEKIASSLTPSRSNIIFWCSKLLDENFCLVLSIFCSGHKLLESICNFH